MNIYFSPANLWFIPEQYKLDGTYSDETWPGDAVLLTENEVLQYWKQSPPDGKCLASKDDKPAWADIPALTQEQLVAAALRKKTSLLAEASEVIAPLKDAFDGGYIEETDKTKLIEWQKYRYALTKVTPENPVWPDKPDI